MPDTDRIEIPREHTALLVVDMQNAFISPTGSMSKLGLSTERARAIVPAVASLLAAFRAQGMPVLHTATVFRADYADAGLVARRFPPLHHLGHLVAGSWDAEIVAELAPLPGEPVITKTRFNAFHDTRLAPTLRELGVDTLVVAGVATNICIDSTVRDAFARDISVILPRDATASYTLEMEDASLTTLGFMFATMTTAAAVNAALATDATVAAVSSPAAEAPVMAGRR